MRSEREGGRGVSPDCVTTSPALPGSSRQSPCSCGSLLSHDQHNVIVLIKVSPATPQTSATTQTLVMKDQANNPDEEVRQRLSVNNINPFFLFHFDDVVAKWISVSG